MKLGSGYRKAVVKFSDRVIGQLTVSFETVESCLVFMLWRVLQNADRSQLCTVHVTDKAYRCCYHFDDYFHTGHYAKLLSQYCVLISDEDRRFIRVVDKKSFVWKSPIAF